MSLALASMSGPGDWLVIDEYHGLGKAVGNGEGMANEKVIVACGESKKRNVEISQEVEFGGGGEY